MLKNQMSKKLIPKGLTGLAVDESEEWGKHPLWDKIRLRNLGYSVPEETYSGGMLPDVNITASAPSIQTKEGTNLAKKMAADVYTGKMLMKDVPRDYQNYVEGEVKGAIPYALREHPGARTVGLGAAYLMGGIGGGMLGQLNVADKVFKPITNQFNKSILGKKVVKPGLEGIDKIFTPSKWGISSYLPESIGRFGDAAVQTSFVIDGLKGLKEQAEEGRLLKNPGETLLNVAMGSPLLSKPIKFGINGYNALRSLRKAEPIVNQVQEVAKEVLPVVNSVKQTSPAYQIERYGGGYMLKSLMEGNPLEKQLSKAGTISVNSIKAQAAKSGKVDLAVIDKVLNSEQFAGLKVIDYNLFRKAVLNELIPSYDINLNPESSIPETIDTELMKIWGSDRIGITQNVKRQSDGVGGLVTTWERKRSPVKFTQFTFESPRIEYFSNKHYTGKPIGSARTFVLEDEPNIMYILENQSDAAQKGVHHGLTKYEKKALHNIEEELKIHPNDEFTLNQRKTILNNNEDRLKKIGTQGSYLFDNYLSRLFLELLKLASENGLSKIRYPRPQTAADIEGYTKVNLYKDPNGKIVSGRDAFAPRSADELLKIMDLNDELIERGTFLRLQGIRPSSDEQWLSLKKQLEESKKRSVKDGYIDLGIEGYPSDLQTILKKYSEFPSMFNKLFKDLKVKSLVDKRGFEWYEVDVPKNYLNMEWLFKKGGRLNKKKLIKKLRNE